MDSEDKLQINNVEDIVSMRIAKAFRAVATLIESGYTSSPEPTKPVAASTATLKRTKKMPEKVAEPKAPREVCGRQDNEQTNVYQILLTEFGNKPFNLEKARHNAFRHVMPLREMTSEMNRLEEEKVALPVDEQRFTWILVRP